MMWRRVLAVTAVTISLASIVVSLATKGASEMAAGLAWPLSNLGVGLMLTLRRPRLVTGWVFVAIGFLSSTGSAADALATSALSNAAPAPWWAVLTVWYGEWYWLPMIYTTLVVLPLLFPTGRPLSPRWRPATVFVLTVLGTATGLAALQERLDPVTGRSVANPIGINGL